MSATISITEDAIEGVLYDYLAGLFDASVAPNIIRGFQNMTATPLGSYIVVSPGQKERQDALVRDYDADAGTVTMTRSTTYSVQVDCYGPQGADWADVIAVTWLSLWACDRLAGTGVTPLDVDQPTQLNIVNGEMMYEPRFMLRLHLQVNTAVTVPQDFATTATVDVNRPVDLT